MICCSELFDATAFRFGLFIGSIVAVIGETSEFYLSSPVKGTYLTIGLSIEKPGQALKCDLENIVLEV